MPPWYGPTSVQPQLNEFVVSLAIGQLDTESLRLLWRCVSIVLISQITLASTQGLINLEIGQIAPTNLHDRKADRAVLSAILV